MAFNKTGSPVRAASFTPVFPEGTINKVAYLEGYLDAMKWNEEDETQDHPDYKRGYEAGLPERDQGQGS
jgi:hypothetical protein